MKGIKMSDCKFYVDEAARTVVCVIPRTRNMVLDFIWDNFQYSDINLADSIEYRMRNELYMPGSFMGKAVCAPDDEWNEETGRIIAFSRAKNKCYQSFFKRANLFIQTLDRRLGDAITSFNDFGMRLEDKKEALRTIIDERIGALDSSEEE